MKAAVVIPCRDEEATVGRVVEAARCGLAVVGGDVIVVANDCSDRSAKTAAAAGATVLERELPGKGGAVALGLTRALKAGAGAVLMLDADLSDPHPSWIRCLLAPILEGLAEFVAPVYIWDARDATITNFFARPALAARRRLLLEQPIGGDFGLSRALAQRLLARAELAPGWGVDIALSALAAEKPGSVVQARLGAKRHRRRDPVTLRAMFEEVFRSLASFPQTHGELAAPPVEGFPPAGPPPEPVAARAKDLLGAAADAAKAALVENPPAEVARLLGACAGGLSSAEWGEAASRALDEPEQIAHLWPPFLARVGEALASLERGVPIDALRAEALEGFPGVEE